MLSPRSGTELRRYREGPGRRATAHPARSPVPRAGSSAAIASISNGGKARYLWAVRLAPIHEAFPLTCPYCAGQMRIVASVTNPIATQSIQAQIGEPARPPKSAPASDPPAWASAIDGGQRVDSPREPVGSTRARLDLRAVHRLAWTTRGADGARVPSAAAERDSGARARRLKEATPSMGAVDARR